MRTRRRTFLATGLVALLTIAGITAAIANDPPPRIAFLANGIVPADALAAGPIAGQLGAPIFTTAPDTLPTSTADAMSDYAPQLVIVMGGPVAISDAVVGQVSAATGLSVASPTPPPTNGIVRAAGEDRFETAAAAAALLAAYDPAYLPTDMQAIDSDKLDGKDSSAFQPAGNYLGKTEKAADSDKLDGRDSSAFASTPLRVQHGPYATAAHDSWLAVTRSNAAGYVDYSAPGAGQAVISANIAAPYDTVDSDGDLLWGELLSVDICYRVSDTNAEVDTVRIYSAAGLELANVATALASTTSTCATVNVPDGAVTADQPLSLVLTWQPDSAGDSLRIGGFETKWGASEEAGPSAAAAQTAGPGLNVD